MDGVEATGFFLGEAQGFDGYEFESGFVNARENLSLQVPTNCVRFDDCEGAFN